LAELKKQNAEEINTLRCENVVMKKKLGEGTQMSQYLKNETNLEVIGKDASNSFRLISPPPTMVTRAPELESNKMKS